jgi:hypothetical protein
MVDFAFVPTLFTYLTFYQNRNSKGSTNRRLEYLATSLFYLSQIAEFKLSILIVSNSYIDNFDELIAPILSRGDKSKVELYVAPEEEYSYLGQRIDWLLLWVHKKYLRKDFESTTSKSGDYFLVLEDDALFTSANLEYFLKHRKPLETIGLIPSFIRSEWSRDDNCWTHEDPLGRIIKTRRVFSYPGSQDLRLMQLLNPFSASICLDYKLAEEYLLSESAMQQKACYKHPVIFDIGSTSTLGLIMENIPSGYLNRVAVVCTNANYYPVPGSVVRHLGDRYANDKWHRNIRLYDHEHLLPLPTQRTVIDYLKRIFLYKDGLVVLRSWLGSKFGFKYLEVLWTKKDN